MAKAKAKAADKELPTGEVAGAPTPTAPVEPAPEKPKKAEKHSTTFEFKNGDEPRTFSQSVHGDDWEALADEFAETNKVKIASRDGK